MTCSTVGVVHSSRYGRWFQFTALLTAVLCAVATYVLWRVFVATARGQRLEQIAFEGSTYGKNHLWGLGQPLLETVSAVYVAGSVLVIVVIALLRKRWGLALQVVVLIGGANVTTQILKKVVFERPDFGVPANYGNSLPSGHTTVAAAASMALLIAVPRRFRPVVAIAGAAYTATMGVSTLVGNWHRASDVVAGILVAALWCALVTVFATRTARDPRDVHSAPWTIAALSMLMVVTLAFGVVAGWLYGGAALDAHAGAVVTDELERRAYVGSVAGVVAVSALVFAVLLGLRQATMRAISRSRDSVA